MPASGARKAAATPLPPEARARIEGVLAQVADPEVPVLSVLDLGLVRHLALRPDGRIEVGLTPTWSGCPATPVIRADVERALARAGFDAVTVEVLSPPWSSDWISEAGRRKLAAFGIAPPDRARESAGLPACPRCGSRNTSLVSEFGSTPCKALHRCEDCREPFDRFKCV